MVKVKNMSLKTSLILFMFFTFVSFLLITSVIEPGRDIITIINSMEIYEIDLVTAINLLVVAILASIGVLSAFFAKVYAKRAENILFDE